MTINVDFQGDCYQGKCELGTTLHQFLQGLGMSQIPEIMETESGRLVVPRFALARQWHGVRLVTAQAPEPKPATLTEELLTSSNL